MKHLLSIQQLTLQNIEDMLHLSEKLKHQLKNGIEHHTLKGKTLGLIFTKSSTRTRVSFEAGMYQLGGYAIFLNSNDIQLGRGESIYDTAQVLSRYIDGIMIRTFKQSDVEDLAKYGNIPVINGLTDLLHPCQVLADLFTIYEKKGQLKGLKLAYIGDGNNVAHSLLHGCTKVGMDISIASPKGFECNSEVLSNAYENAKLSSSKLLITQDPLDAVQGADIVYTDTWVSMGQESGKEQKIKTFMPYQVNDKLMSEADKDAIFLHCLPAYRGYEVTQQVIDGPQSCVFEQAENRLHVQKAVLTMLLG